MSEQDLSLHLYDEPEVQQAVLYAAELKRAIEQASPRPVSPVYPRISQAAYEISLEDAIQRAHEQIDEALATF
jgi:hypothetical protein